MTIIFMIVYAIVIFAMALVAASIVHDYIKKN